MEATLPAVPFAFHVRFPERIGIFAAHSAVPNWPAFHAFKLNPRQHSKFIRQAAGDLCRLIHLWNPILPPDWIVTVPPQGASLFKTVNAAYPARHLARAVASALHLKFRECLSRPAGAKEKRYHGHHASLAQTHYLAAASARTALIIDDLLTTGTTMRLSLAAMNAVKLPAFGFAWALGRRTEAQLHKERFQKIFLEVPDIADEIAHE